MKENKQNCTDLFSKKPKTKNKRNLLFVTTVMLTALSTQTIETYALTYTNLSERSATAPSNIYGKVVESQTEYLYRDKEFTDTPITQVRTITPMLEFGRWKNNGAWTQPDSQAHREIQPQTTYREKDLTDKSGTTIEVTGNPTEWTNKDVTLTVKATNAGSGVKKIRLPNGKVVTGDTATYTVDRNGNYEFRVTDNAGNETTETVKVTNIDKTKPTIKVTGIPKEWTNKDVTLAIAGTDSQSGVRHITLPDGRLVNGTHNLFTGFTTTGFITATGAYTANDPAILSDYIEVNSLNFAFRQFKDNGEPVNKYGEFAFYDKDKKFISVRVDTNETRDENVRAPEGTKYIRVWSKMVEGSTGLGMLVYTKEKPSTINHYVPYNLPTYKVSENGDYTFKAIDNAGNEVIETVSVTKIDKTKPTIEITGNPTEWTNQDVALNIEVSDTQSGVNFIQLPDGKFLTKGENLFTGFVTTGFITATGTYTANDPAILSDYIEVNSLNFAFRQFKDNGEPVNKYGEFAFYDKDKKFISVRVDTNETRDENVRAPEGTKYIRVWSKMVEGSTGLGMLVYTKEKPSTINRYIPHGKVLIGDTATYMVGANGEYTFKVFDVVGNVTTKTVNVTKIDKIAPTIDYHVNKNSGSSAILSVTYSDNHSGLQSIIRPNGESKVFSSVVRRIDEKETMTQNSLILVSAIDKAGNKSSKSIDLLTLFTDTTSSGVSRIEYKLTGATVKDWTDYTAPFYVTNEGVTTVTARVYDEAGNVSSEKTSTVRIDKTKPTNNSILIEIK